MFKIGDKVHYPGHGICTIKTIFNKESASGDGPTYILKPTNAAFKFQRLVLPHNKAINLGVHYLIKKEDVPKIYEILKQEPNNYSHSRIRGYIETREKLDSGDIFKIAEATRDLEAIHDFLFMPIRISLLRKAKRILTEELANVENISKQEAVDSINKTLMIANNSIKNG